MKLSHCGGWNISISLYHALLCLGYRCSDFEFDEYYTNPINTVDNIYTSNTITDNSVNENDNNMNINNDDKYNKDNDDNIKNNNNNDNDNAYNDYNDYAEMGMILIITTQQQ